MQRGDQVPLALPGLGLIAALGLSGLGHGRDDSAERWPLTGSGRCTKTPWRAVCDNSGRDSAALWACGFLFPPTGFFHAAGPEHGKIPDSAATGWGPQGPLWGAGGAGAAIKHWQQALQPSALVYGGVFIWTGRASGMVNRGGPAWPRSAMS